MTEIETYDALVLRLRAAGCIFAEDEARVLLSATSDPARLEELTARRVAGAPLEHVVGWVDFAGVRLAIGPGVFVPRQRTAALAFLASAAVPEHGVVVDLCCGAGAVGLVLATRHPGIELHASDVDPAAVDCARRNLEPFGATVHQGDLDAALPDRLRGRVDVLVANVPYVPTHAIALMPPESRDHEPRVAVDGGADGLDVVRRLAALAPHWLAPGGSVYVETVINHAAAVCAAFEEAGLVATVHHDDELGATLVTARHS